VKPYPGTRIISSYRQQCPYWLDLRTVNFTKQNGRFPNNVCGKRPFIQFNPASVSQIITETNFWIP
ncbi:MAG: hypothetical protein KC413_16920, partial [Anaerolineales bacterium]|nr:hypothetical protein [Anaerolineales bacterium]